MWIDYSFSNFVNPFFSFSWSLRVLLPIRAGLRCCPATASAPVAATTQTTHRIQLFSIFFYVHSVVISSYFLVTLSFHWMDSVIRRSSYSELFYKLDGSRIPCRQVIVANSAWVWIQPRDSIINIQQMFVFSNPVIQY